MNKRKEKKTKLPESNNIGNLYKFIIKHYHATQELEFCKSKEAKHWRPLVLAPRRFMNIVLQLVLRMLELRLTWEQCRLESVMPMSGSEYSVRSIYILWSGLPSIEGISGVIDTKPCGRETPGCAWNVRTNGSEIWRSTHLCREASGTDNHRIHAASNLFTSGRSVERTAAAAAGELMPLDTSIIQSPLLAPLMILRLSGQ